MHYMHLLCIINAYYAVYNVFFRILLNYIHNPYCISNYAVV